MRFIAIVLLPLMLFARDIYVSALNGNDAGDGTRQQPFKSLAVAVNEARDPGDTVILLDGPFDRPLKTYHSGTREKPITIRAAENAPVEIVYAERALHVRNSHIVVEGLIFDGGTYPDGVLATIDGNNVTLRDCEIRNGNRDLLTIGDVRDITIENCLIHHGLSWHRTTRKEPHGISTRGVKGLKVINTSIYQITGDCIQISPSRADWDDIELRDCTFWVTPLTEAEVDRARLPSYAVGSVQAENALDLKSDDEDLPTEHKIRIINCTAYGFRSTRINNAAAFNIKNPSLAFIDGCTVYDSEIAFRLRAPSEVTLQNSVIYDCDYGVRYEDGMDKLHLFQNTFGLGIKERALREVGSTPRDFQAFNNLFVDERLPGELDDDMLLRAHNRAVSPADVSSWFINAPAHNYQPVPTSPAIDGGMDLSAKGVINDIDGNPRPAGQGYDFGAWEVQPEE